MKNLPSDPLARHNHFLSEGRRLADLPAGSRVASIAHALSEAYAAGAGATIPVRREPFVSEGDLSLEARECVVMIRRLAFGRDSVPEEGTAPAGTVAFERRDLPVPGIPWHVTLSGKRIHDAVEGILSVPDRTVSALLAADLASLAGGLSGAVLTKRGEAMVASGVCTAPAPKAPRTEREPQARIPGR